jgi:transcriptional regulator with XRE-family HTH domain
MKPVFEFSEYRDFVRAWVKAQPNGGRGAYRRIAEELRLSTVLVSQVFKGDRHLSLEAAADLAEKVLGLTDLEQRYFLLLVSKERAGSAALQKHYEAQIAELRAKSKNLSQVVKQDAVLDDAAKARFHSDWIYSAIRLGVSIPTLSEADALAAALKIPAKQVHEAVEFLLEKGLIRQEGERLVLGPSTTHLEAESPYIWGRQVAWRTKGFQEMRKADPQKLFYTAPIVLSEEDLTWLRASVVKLIGEITERAKASDSETLVCFNVDLFRVLKGK